VPVVLSLSASRLRLPAVIAVVSEIPKQGSCVDGKESAPRKFRQSQRHPSTRIPLAIKTYKGFMSSESQRKHMKLWTTRSSPSTSHGDVGSSATITAQTSLGVSRKRFRGILASVSKGSGKFKVCPSGAAASS